jgi:hypothetical protein
VLAVGKEKVVGVANLGTCPIQNGTLLFESGRRFHDLDLTSEGKIIKRGADHPFLCAVEYDQRGVGCGSFEDSLMVRPKASALCLQHGTRIRQNLLLEVTEVDYAR